jgi:hypothetical protein
MADIHTIKNLLYFFPYLKEETWYMIGLSISIYVTYIVYLMAFEQYHRKQSSNSEIIQSISVQDRLNNLQIQDGLFFEKLSFTIRTHLEDSDLVH